MKKLLLACLALTLVLCLLPTTAEAATEGNFTYEISDGKATITDCKTSVSGDITIPSTLGGCPVTTISNGAFFNCTGLTSVTIPDSVTAIGYYAFQDCTGLTAVTIGDSVTSIEGFVFYGCTGLTSVTIGDSVTTIEGSAFYGCTALEEITIPVSMFSIADDAFQDVPLKTVHYGGTKEQWEKIDLNNNVCFATAEVKTTEKPADPAPGAPADPSEPTDPSTPTEPSTPAPTEPSAPGNPTEPEKANHTICLVAIVVLSLALAGSITLNLLQHKKKKA